MVAEVEQPEKASTIDHKQQLQAKNAGARSGSCGSPVRGPKVAVEKVTQSMQ